VLTAKITIVRHGVTTFQTTSNSWTFPSAITLLSMYVSMIISHIQLLVSYMGRKTTTCSSTGYYARLFTKKNLKNIGKYFILVPLSNNTCS